MNTKWVGGKIEEGGEAVVWSLEEVVAEKQRE